MNEDNSNIPQDSEEDAALHQKLMALDWDMQPSKDLWEGIASKIDVQPRRRAKSGKHLGWAPYAVAASLMLAVVSLLFSYLNYEKTREMGNIQAVYVRYQQSQVALIEQQHQMVRTQFVRLMEAKRSELDPELIAEVEVMQQAVDAAASELRVAIVAQPYNPSYSIMLVQTYQKEMKFLNKIKFNEELSI